MRLVFWQNAQCHHQSAHLRALASHPGCEVTLVTPEELPAERRANGWYVPDFGDVRLVVDPGSEEIEKLLTQAERESVHVFTGPHAYPLVWNAFRRSLATEATLGIYSEPGKWKEGIKGKLRLARGRWHAHRFKKRVDFILAAGGMAVEWFRMIGYPEDMIHRYGYFVEKPNLGEIVHDVSSGTETVEIVYVGQLIRRKGMDLLLDALGGLDDLDWHLRIIGDGPERKHLEAQCRQLSLDERVRFLGMLTNTEAMQGLATSDLHVLPSRWDGWGTTVGEALMRGVPSVCSDHCGSADLLDGSERGETFVAGSAQDLFRVLRRRISDGKKTIERAERIQAWSQAIQGESAAQYLLDIVDRCKTEKPKPTPPWMRHPLPVRAEASSSASPKESVA